MDSARLLVGIPPALAISDEQLKSLASDRHRVLVVLDDDPTGTQAVADVPVLVTRDVADFEWAFAQHVPAVYALTNSRSHDEDTARLLNREVVVAALEAGERMGCQVNFASRGDSTLRGHFPLEPDSIIDTLVERGVPRPDAVIVIPAFPDAGRVTIGGVHGILDAGTFTPIGETEFARDATFGFRASALADWVTEKSAGRIAATDVVAISLDDIRSGRAAERLRQTPSGSVVVCDTVVEEDLHHLALAIDELERAGRRYVYRVGPAFVRARIGQRPRAPIDPSALATRPETTSGGLIVVGSHVGVTQRQLAHLQQNRDDIPLVELNVPALIGSDAPSGLIAEVTERVACALEHGDVILATSRDLVRTDDPAESLDISRRVSDALVEVVQGVVSRRVPAYVLAKGGITSSDIASRGLGMSRATAVGSLFPGIVSVWRSEDGPAAGIPYVVFAGNVGGDDTLTGAIERLSTRTRKEPS